MKTGEGLARFAEKCAAAKTPYIYATFGQILTERKLADVKKNYPERLSEQRYKYARDHYVGRRTNDCYGMIKRYKWTDGEEENPSIDGTPIYNGLEDRNANAAFEKATVKGKIGTIPEVRGLCVRYPGHVGVYLTGGKVAEARGFDYGTVITDLDSRPWTDWFQEDGIQYEERKADKCMIENYVLRKGMNGPETKEAVKSLQILLNGRGYRDKDGIPLSVDGSFGSKTDFAVKKFQLDSYPACGEADGVVGTLTWTKLING